jgi:intein/homing endonuclease
MASRSAVLRGATSIPGGARPTPAPQGAGYNNGRGVNAPSIGQVSPLAAQLANEGGYARAYGPFLPRPTQSFTEGAFGPFSPILPVPVDAPPPDADRPEARRWQYPVGWNLPTGQPGNEGLKLANFDTLRRLADVYSVARAAIEFRKNQIRGIDWDIIPTPDAAKAYQNNPAKMADFGKRQAKAKKFFNRPDKNYFSFSLWLGALLEEVFVYDALSLLVIPTWGKGYGKGVLGSDLDSLMLIDGSTVRPLVDLHGGIPRPPAAAYQQYLYGVPRSDYMTIITDDDIAAAGISGQAVKQFRGDQLIYAPMVARPWTPYGFGPIERAIIPIQTGIQKQGYQYDWFSECQSDDTEILTRDGWKLFEKLTDEDEVATRGKNGAFEWQKPLKRQKYWNDGQMVHFSSQTTDILVTGNHRMLVRRPDYYISRHPSCDGQDWHFREAAFFADNPTAWFEYAVTSRWENGAGPSEFTLETPLSRACAKSRRPDSWVKCQPSPDISIPMTQFCAFIGLFIAEGWTTGHGIFIGQASTSRYLGEIKEILEGTGLSWRYDAPSGKFSVRCADLAAWLHDNCGHLAWNKRVPAGFKELPAAQLERLLRGMMIGDGHICANGSRDYVTTSPQLADDVQELLQKTGSDGYVRSRMPHSSSKGKRRQYRVIERLGEGKNLTYSRSKPKWVDYKGYVYCVTVPNGVIYTRRNGNPAWTGNSSVPAAYIIPGDTAMTPNQLRELQDALNAIAGDPSWKQKLIVLPAGSHVEPQRPTVAADELDQLVMTQVCCVPGTKIITKRGLVPIESVAVGDEVITHRGRWRPVTRTMTNQVHEPVREITARGFDPLQVTGNHPVWTAHYGKVKPNKQQYHDTSWVAARDVKPRPGHEKDGWDALTLPIPVMGNSDAKLNLADHIHGRSWWVEEVDGMLVHSNPLVQPIPAVVPLNAAFGRLLGLYMAEGCVNGGGIGWAFHKDEVAYQQQVIDDLESVFGVTAKVKPPVASNPNCRAVICSNALLGELFTLGKAGTKTLPTWAWDGSPEFYAALLWGWVAGDGHAKPHGWMGNTTSENLAWQMRLVAIACGLEPSLTKGNNTNSTFGREGYRCENPLPMYRVSVTLEKEDSHRGTYRLDGPCLTSSVKSNEPSSYDGNVVYNLEVEEDESYVTTGGTIHNCMAFAVSPMELGISPRASATTSPGAANQMAKAAQNTSQDTGLTPILMYLQDLFNTIIVNVCGQTDMMFTFEGLQEEEDMDSLTGVLVQQLQNGMRTLDECRQELNLQPYGLEESTEPLFVTPQGPMPLSTAVQNAENAAAQSQAQTAQTQAQTGNTQAQAESVAARSQMAQESHEVRMNEPVPAPATPPAAGGKPVPAQKPVPSAAAGAEGVAEGGKPTPGHNAAQAANNEAASAKKSATITAANETNDRRATAEFEALARHLTKGRHVSTWEARFISQGSLAEVAKAMADGLDPASAVSLARARAGTVVLPASEYAWQDDELTGKIASVSAGEDGGAPFRGGGGVTFSEVEAADLVKVGPHGYVHGWIKVEPGEPSISPNKFITQTDFLVGKNGPKAWNVKENPADGQSIAYYNAGGRVIGYAEAHPDGWKIATASKTPITVDAPVLNHSDAIDAIAHAHNDVARAISKNDPGQKAYRNALKDWKSKVKLTKAERSAITDYVGGDGGMASYAINATMRGTDDTWKNDQSNQRNIESLTHVVARYQLPQQVTLYRGATLELPSNPVGAIISDKAFTSTSFDQNEAENFIESIYQSSHAGETPAMFRISASAGTHAIIVPPGIGYDDQDERQVILAPGGSYKITGVTQSESGYPVYDAEVVA